MAVLKPHKEQPMRVAFIGLGVMGFPMAGHLAKAGHEVRVFNRSAAKAQAWAADYEGSAFGTASEAAQDCDLVALCVGNDEDVRGVVTEILPSLAANGLIVDHTTTSAKVAKEMALQAAQSGKAFLDAPVSGGQAGAVNGALTIMVGGDLAAYDRAVPVISAYAKAVRRMGEAGSGQLAKMVNQICIAGVVQGLAEAVHFAKNAGLDTDEVLAAISQGAAQSWQMDNRWKTMAEGTFEFGFAVDWMRKDLGLVLDEARTNGSHLAVTALVDQFYSEIQAMGGRRWDTSSLAARLER
jgi:3-hydroxyisobutyrate dehydrogenase